MDSLFFPFTFTTKFEAEALAVCFERCTMMMPSEIEVPDSMRELVDRGWLSLAFPFGADDTAVAAAINNYQRWADQHGSGQLRQMVEQLPRTPFSDDSSMYQLLKEIKAYRQQPPTENNHSRSRSDFILNSRIFLSIAQEYDHHIEAFREDVAAVESKEREFKNYLHATPYNGGAHQPTDPFYHHDRDYMLFERLKAWTCFLLDLDLSSNLFVTTCRPVVDRLISAIPAVEPIVALKRIPVRDRTDADAVDWREALDLWLSEYRASNGCDDAKDRLQPPKAKNKERTVSLTVYHTEKSSGEWFGQTTGNEVLMEKAFDGPHQEKATLLAYVKNE